MIKEEREKECENIFVKRICSRLVTSAKIGGKCDKNMCSKREEEAEIFAANVFRVSSTRRRRFRIFFFLIPLTREER